ncbi:hypothetical protein BD769DRAFT_70732 [Suillus cothurnatus]|nr:hypothetical protein BD769DRAFT_70732 [Suillus cothurnatus]
MTLIDFLIASSLCYLLISAKTGFAKTDITLRTLVRDIINTGCLTSMCSMACIITDAAMPNSFVFLGIEFLLSKLYVNSYMALLNARHYLGSDGSSYSSQIDPRMSIALMCMSTLRMNYKTLPECPRWTGFRLLIAPWNTRLSILLP